MKNTTMPLCPECRDGKTTNCVGAALDPETDDFVTCNTQTTLVTGVTPE